MALFDPGPGKKPMNWDDPWVMGHEPGFEFWKHQRSAAERAISREQFIRVPISPGFLYRFD
jgi:hypothetical protein